MMELKRGGCIPGKAVNKLLKKSDMEAGQWQRLSEMQDR